MNFKKILIINPFGIGDVLFTTPLLSNLRHAYPQARIVYLSNRRTSELLARNPHIDHVMTYDRDEFIALYKKNVFMFLKKWLDFVRGIKLERFDLVFDFSLTDMFSFVSWFCRIPKRIGYNYRNRGWLLTDNITFSSFQGRHVIEYYLDLLQMIEVPVIETAMSFGLRPEDEAWAEQWLRKQGIAGQKPLFAVVPGGGASWGDQARAKRWPGGHFRDLVHKLIAEKGGTVILVGDVKEEQLCCEIAQQASFPVYSAVGQTSIVQMAALFKRCDCVFVNDGGPLHVAVAVGARTVSIFGPVDDAVYGPYPRQGHQVVKLNLPCQPCYRNFRKASCSHLSCLKDLPVDKVFQLIERQL